MSTWSTDLSHCPPHDATGIPLAARRRGQFFRELVEAATSRPAGPAWSSAVRCLGRVGRKRCTGWMDVSYVPGRAVEWSCKGCKERGVITGVEGSQSDLSRYVPRSKTRLWGIDEQERAFLCAATSSLPELRAIVARSRPHADIPGLLLVDATVAELDEMYSLVEALTDTKGGRRRLDLLDELRRSLCTAIDGF